MTSKIFYDINRHIALQDALSSIFGRLETDFNADGFATTEIHDAMEEVLDRRRQALSEDPDPADDPE
jgi:hypothetical protein